jgi:ABC-2 type transport system permease protein
MKTLWSVARLDILDSFRSKWFIAYALIFIALLLGIFFSGVTESRVMGFTGMTRLLLVFIQACNIILPIFILITTVRTISKERESAIFEYMLSFPISLASYYWGKALGRFIVILSPLLLSMLIALILGVFKGAGAPWQLYLLYTGLLISSSVVYLGLGFLISSTARSQELALGWALVIWLALLAFIDVALIGFMIQQALPDNLIFAIALLNPVQVFRIGAISLFDPVLSVIGPAAYFILDNFGHAGFIAYALLYPVALGAIALGAGYWFFRKKDLV